MSEPVGQPGRPRVAASDRFIVAARHQWNRRVFDRLISPMPGQWEFVDSREGLEAAFRREPAPRYAFFLHWPFKVPADLTARFECVAFHMTDVPYGRGGTPLQNLILRGHTETKLTALRMTDELDAGPVYLKRGLDLSGKASEIYERMSTLAADMIRTVVEEDIQPVPQTGEPTRFMRRKPADSLVPDGLDAGGLYDFIRMLDAPGYPRAFLRHGDYRVELSDAALEDTRVKATATLEVIPRDDRCDT